MKKHLLLGIVVLFCSRFCLQAMHPPKKEKYYIRFIEGKDGLIEVKEKILYQFEAFKVELDFQKKQKEQSKDGEKIDRTIKEEFDEDGGKKTIWDISYYIDEDKIKKNISSFFDIANLDIAKGEKKADEIEEDLLFSFIKFADKISNGFVQKECTRALIKKLVEIPTVGLNKKFLIEGLLYPRVWALSKNLFLLKKNHDTLVLYDVHSQDSIETFQMEGAFLGVSPIDERRFLSHSQNAIYLWDIEKIKPIKKHETNYSFEKLFSYCYRDIKVLKDKNKFVTNHFELAGKSSLLWDLKEITLEKKILKGGEHCYHLLEYLPGTDKVLVSDGFSIFLYDLYGGRIKEYEKRGPVKSIVHMPNTKKFLSGEYWGIKKVVDPKILTPGLKRLTDGFYIKNGLKIFLWDLEKTEPIKEFKVDGFRQIVALPDGKHFCVSFSNRISLWHIEEEEIFTFYEDDFIGGMALTPKGERIICFTKDTISVFDLFPDYADLTFNQVDLCYRVFSLDKVGMEEEVRLTKEDIKPDGRYYEVYKSLPLFFQQKIDLWLSYSLKTYLKLLKRAGQKVKDKMHDILYLDLAYLKTDRLFFSNFVAREQIFEKYKEIKKMLGSKTKFGPPLKGLLKKEQIDFYLEHFRKGLKKVKSKYELDFLYLETDRVFFDNSIIRLIVFDDYKKRRREFNLGQTEFEGPPDPFRK